MKLNKEFEEKLRKFLSLTENPLDQIRRITQLRGMNDGEIIQAMQLRLELIEMINTPSLSGKYKQLDLEEEIQKTKSIHENY